MPPRRSITVAILLAFSIASAIAQNSALSPTPPAFHLIEAKIDDIHTALKSGRTTCRQVVGFYLKRIEAYNKSGPGLNAVQTVNPNALQEAERLDAAFKSAGLVGPLHCIPVLVKDQVETSGLRTTYGSAVFKDFVPQRDATIVGKMKNAGAVILGKTTMGEYAYGYVSSASGVIRNAYDPARTASGSSGGTGSSIAANFATIGIGEDTGGSIRGPASVNSLVGLRPTLPLVSRYGMMPASPSTDTLGPIARTVKDAAILLGVIAGYDPNDPATAYSVGQVPASYTTFLTRDGLKGARLGILREPIDPKTDPTSEDYKKVRTVIDKAIADLKALGAELVDPVTIPELSDRVKKGYDANVFETEQAMNNYLALLPNAPVKTLQEIVMSGKVIPWRATKLMNNIGKSTGDIGYLQVLLVREETREIVLKLMADKKLDVVVYATFDHQPTMIAADILTNPNTQDKYGLGNNRYLAATLRFPAMTVPAGFTSDALPVGIEFMARPFAEGTLFKLAYAFEQGTLNRKPPATTPALRGEP